MATVPLPPNPCRLSSTAQKVLEISGHRNKECFKAHIMRHWVSSFVILCAFISLIVNWLHVIIMHSSQGYCKPSKVILHIIRTACNVQKVINIWQLALSMCRSGPVHPRHAEGRGQWGSIYKRVFLNTWLFTRKNLSVAINCQDL